MRIIPAIDIIDGQCVRLTKGDYGTKKAYSTDPLEQARLFESHGFQYLHLVDLDGAKANKIVNHKILESIARETSLKIDFGGGIRTDKDISIAFECGASQVTAGSMSVDDPRLFLASLTKHGGDKIILGADFINRKIATQAWQQKSSVDVVDFIAEYEKQGVIYVICTDISKDGMLAGTSNEIYREIIEKTSIRLIASGGVSTTEDLKELKAMGCDAAIVGKAIYENRINLKSLIKAC